MPGTIRSSPELAAVRNAFQRVSWRSAGFLPAVAATGLAFGVGLNYSDIRQRTVTADAQARAVESFALSSVAGSVPGRESARKAQAAAIMEAQRMGLDISIASVGIGGKPGGNAAADAQAFGRLVRRFPETLKAAEEEDAFRERLSKA